MRSIKYVFITTLAAIISACSAPQDHPNYYYDDKNIHALIYSIEEGDTAAIKTLLDSGVNVNTVGKNGVTPLFWSYLKLDEHLLKKDVFKLLLKNGADPHILHDPTGKSVLTYAAINIHDSDYLRIILEEVEDINVDQKLEKHPVYPTALYQAIFNKNYDNVKLLLQYGANPNYASSPVRTPLSSATGIRWDIAYLLLQNEADYNYIGLTGRFNPFNRRQIVRSLENNTYWPSDDPENWREKVIEFVREKGIEVYPKYPEDDPRYNPRPELTSEDK